MLKHSWYDLLTLNLSVLEFCQKLILFFVIRKIGDDLHLFHIVGSNFLVCSVLKILCNYIYSIDSMIQILLQMFFGVSKWFLLLNKYYFDFSLWIQIFLPLNNAARAASFICSILHPFLIKYFEKSKLFPLAEGI
jgi:hypothetical protein